MGFFCKPQMVCTFNLWFNKLKGCFIESDKIHRGLDTARRDSESAIFNLLGIQCGKWYIPGISNKESSWWLQEFSFSEEYRTLEIGCRKHILSTSSITCRDCKLLLLVFLLTERMAALNSKEFIWSSWCFYLKEVAILNLTDDIVSRNCCYKYYWRPYMSVHSHWAD